MQVPRRGQGDAIIPERLQLSRLACMSRQLGVRYIRRDRAAPELPVTLIPEMLAPLPEERRRALGTALERLDGDAIRQVGRYDRKLEKALSRLADKNGARARSAGGRNTLYFLHMPEISS